MREDRFLSLFNGCWRDQPLESRRTNTEASKVCNIYGYTRPVQPHSLGAAAAKKNNINSYSYTRITKFEVEAGLNYLINV